MTESEARCATCFGTGGVFDDFGGKTCPDCQGEGALPSAPVLRERRLRELEATLTDDAANGPAVRWLITEVRRANHVLVQILAAALEASDEDAIGRKIRFLANQALDMYAVERDSDTE